ncbi:hypothetical protein L210DRAFT_3545775 [Boletus edulis BED1]|uniref:C2 domain-containing protein n=1 Tax=Boletus edulis BED1 TaxID=1328754 RepID=A0AAD4BR40_BOLED|nr:hypothetical protein L210DRAFT_3545775 [Boletus edulis BED1]
MPNPTESMENIVDQHHPRGRAGVAAKVDGAIQAAKDSWRGVETKYVDVTIQFIGASLLGVVGTTDPFFHATLDHRLSYISSVQPNTLTPVWNEVWQVKNVPTTAMLSVVIRDKHHKALIDHYIGKFETTIYPGAKEAVIQGPMYKHDRGTFWLKMESSPSRKDPALIPYLFDGPVHYSCHSSPTMGALTHLRDTRLYSTWKVYIKGVPQIFGDQVQHWNRNYRAAQVIFQGPTSIAVRSGIQAGHRLLYARSASNVFGVIKSAEDVFALFRGGTRRSSTDGTVSYAHRIKPAVYTYIISADDDSLRFSETGAAFFVDFASKHALHSNCAKTVRYSGEFHPRPVGGWARLSDAMEDKEVEWEIVIDNNSGTYSPDPDLLPKVKEIIGMNFSGFRVVALRHEDPELKASTEACRAYALSKRGVAEHELQPHVTEGEETLMHQASRRWRRAVLP